MQKRIVDAGQYTELISKHLGANGSTENCWRINPSSVGGLGVFANKAIAENDVIFEDHAVLSGPKAKQSLAIRPCCVCYALLEGNDMEILCRAGCCLPICKNCSTSPAHMEECKLLCSWKPRYTNSISVQMMHVVNILPIIRALWLSREQRQLLNGMQANCDRFYKAELQRASDSFLNFPQTNIRLVLYLERTICLFNTNAFEGSRLVGDFKVATKALFPLAGIMNHHCLPNAGHYFKDDGSMVVLATRPIAEGEEIFTMYTRTLWDNLARNAFLKVTKSFQCECERCLDPTENGTYLSALYCREAQCKGLVIPEHSKSLQPNWICIKCQTVFPHSKMARYQDFALNTINNRINTCSINEMMTFINEVCPRFCPSSNYILIEAKLNVLWRMSRLQCSDQPYTEEQLKYRNQYRNEILEILKKLGAGDCNIRKLIAEDIN